LTNRFLATFLQRLILADCGLQHPQSTEISEKVRYAGRGKAAGDSRLPMKFAGTVAAY